MCFPIAAAAVGAVLSVAQAAVGFQAAQDDYNDRAQMWQQNYVNALASGRDEQNQLQLRMIEEEEASSQRQRQNIIEGAQVRSEAEASAAAANVGGISVGNIMLGINRQIADKKIAEETNYRNKVRQLQTENEATVNKIQNRINSVPRPRSPSPAGYIIQGIGGALGAFS